MLSGEDPRGMPRAFVLIREAPWYRRQAFADGLKKCGFEVLLRPDRARPGDVLLIWNRYSANHAIATRFEAEGGTVVVCENGYLGVGGSSPKFDVHPGGPKPEHYYAVALGYHNGAGQWSDGGPERWEALGVEVKPWRREGGHILIAPNRSFGVPGRVMHPDWAERCAARLRKTTKREVRVRVHPGNDQPRRQLSADLEGAWACVIWTSGAGVHALVAGVPVFCEAPFWISKAAASGGTVDEPTLPDRMPALHRLAWAQWQIQEIETGEPFRRLLA